MLYRSARLSVSLGAALVVFACAQTHAAQKIIFSEPEAPIADLTSKDRRLEESTAKGLFSKREEAFGSEPVVVVPPPEVTAKKNGSKRDMFSNSEEGSDAVSSMMPKRADDVYGLASTKGKDSKGLDPWQTSRYSDSSRERDQERERERDRYAGSSGSADRRLGQSGSLDRLTSGASSLPGNSLRSLVMDRMQQEQIDRIDEFKALYPTPSPTAPVTGANDTAKMMHDTLWQNSAASSHNARPDIYYRGPQGDAPQSAAALARPTREDTTPRSVYNSVYSKKTDSYEKTQSEVRKPSYLPIPKRPGDLFSR